MEPVAEKMVMGVVQKSAMINHLNLTDLRSLPSELCLFNIVKK